MFRSPALSKFPASLLRSRRARAGTAGLAVLALAGLAAVVLVVAVIVGLGMLWAHASGGPTGAGIAVRRAPSGKALLRLQQIKAGVIRTAPDSGFHLGDTSNLIRTGEIEAVLAAVVIAVSAVRLRQRRLRRGAAVRA